ncbi:MAG: TrmH family RNA methyltransferase [Candidatus Nomurabacteria bacterium]|jgi:tRNA G18 (ribose-2'-O)-methylase SpoU|nr:TrmH family RNA methyltransferase [Candidatus Nomurabacteria bacterium]
MLEIVVLVHNIRSTFNVGSILRTSDGFGIRKVIFSGYTPYPSVENDTRLPFEREKLDKQIEKTALGATEFVDFEHSSSVFDVIARLRDDGFKIFALEQDSSSTKLADFTDVKPENGKVALLLGEEVTGISADLLKLMDMILEIPMVGRKESFNVASAFAVAVWEMVRR